MESNWIFCEILDISLGFLNINWKTHKIWNILRITGILTYGTSVSPGCEKVKVRAFNGVVDTVFSADIIPKEGVHYT